MPKEKTVKPPSFGCPNCGFTMHFKNEVEGQGRVSWVRLVGETYQTHTCKIEGCLVGSVVISLKQKEK